MDTVTLRNLTTAALTLVLEHWAVCLRMGRCLCQRGAPLTLRLAPQESRRGLPRAYLEAPDVRRAIRERRVAVLGTSKVQDDAGRGYASPPRAEGKGKDRDKGRGRRGK